MKRIILFGFSFAALFAAFTTHAQQALKKITIGHTGSSCQAPVYVAKEKGFFAEEGLDVDFVVGDWNFLREGLAFGKIQAAQGLVMNFLKPIEQGLDVRFTAGIHQGCIYIFAPKDSPLKSVAELKGKRIGVPGIGSAPWILATRAVAAEGIDVKSGVEWRAYPPGELKLALDRGDVDVIATLDPAARVILNTGTVKTILDQGKTEPFKDEYCCVVVVNGKVARDDQDTAARLTRAILKASKWVAANPQEAAIVSVERKHVGASVEVNSQVFTHLNYIPSVQGGADAVETAALAMQQAGILLPTTNVKKLLDKTFLHLPGVTDAWLNGVSVEKVAALPPAQLRSYLATLGITPDQAGPAVDLCGVPDTGALGPDYQRITAATAQGGATVAEVNSR
ncbi:ABC transporter substrate-binding protein [Opitutaceae bacterium TAV4]|nr:ABC transporter substrate-binding protein [Opitutaceae bacterium TAV4]RRK00316.1 ABC transporter substrate-binding protein [Opitutaceae bacterium TAV3]